MTTQNTNNTPAPKTALQHTAAWLWLSIAAAFLSVAGSVIGLSVGRIYVNLTPAFLPQALAQDIANLAIVSPAWLVLAALALRGSLRAYLLWLGVLIFTVYNYVIYTFSVPFGPLFLLWVVVFGLCVYALIGGIASVGHQTVKASFTSVRTMQVVAWILVITCILFGLLWLSEDVPALLSGKTPQTLIDMGLPTNPVHILDLGFFLPGAIAISVLLLKKNPLAYSLSPAFIVFLILTGIPILITPIVQAVRGETAAWGVFAPIGTLTVILLGLLGWLLSTMRTPEQTA